MRAAGRGERLPHRRHHQGQRRRGTGRHRIHEAAGIVAISDDGQPVMNARVMRRAMEFARSYDLPVIEHCEDLNLSAGGDMHEGAQSVRSGLRGIPARLRRRDGGARYPPRRSHWRALSRRPHLLPARRRDGRIREVARDCAVTCEATPHHFVAGRLRHARRTTATIR